MKIVILSTSDISGGAAIAAHRLHVSLLESGIDSIMVVQNKLSDEFKVIGPKTKIIKFINLIRPTIDQLPTKLYKHRTKTLFSPALLGFNNTVDIINNLNPDIVHLHWINGGMLKIEDLKKIKAPIVWNMQDMWPFTGGCHYDEECGEYVNSCNNCKVLQKNKLFNLSNIVFIRKQRTFKQCNIFPVGVSNWISYCAKNSTLFKQNQVSTIHNCIDTNLFSNIDKKVARSIFKLPLDKKIILFGAMNVLGDPRKGAKQLFQALETLNYIDNTIVVIAGKSQPETLEKIKYETYFIPPLKDESSLVLLNNIADVVIVPSIQENLANTIIESLSCGVPVVAFNIGGNSDMIQHLHNGYLAKPLDHNDLALGIEWVLNNKNYDAISNNARTTVITKFDCKKIVQKYIELYKKIIG